MDSRIMSNQFKRAGRKGRSSMATLATLEIAREIVGLWPTEKQPK